jgi:hypothetical protein
MPLTKVQVISNVVTIMGKKVLITLENQGDLVTAAEQAFDFLFQSTLSIGFWRFATRIQQLSRLAQTPVGGYWNYAYQLPSDYLEMVHLWPQTYDWEIYENHKIYSNYNDSGQPLYIEYVFMPVITNVPDYFWYYFVYEIALYLCLSNAQMVQYYNALLPIRDRNYGIALAKDAQNRPQTPLQSRPIISRRYVATFAGG